MKNQCCAIFLYLLENCPFALGFQLELNFNFLQGRRIGEMRKFRFSIDRGGTFTDIYAELPDDSSKVYKLLSRDPNNYEDAPREGIRRIMRDFYLKNNIDFPCNDDQKNNKIPTKEIESIRMGTTVATNALLEREGSKFIFVTSKGLSDVLQIGNQTRSFIFDLQMRKPAPLYTKAIEINERVRIATDKKKAFENSELKETSTGEFIEILERVNEEEVRNELKKYYSEGIKSIGVALMHSYCFPDHELIIGRIAKEIGYTQISLSSQIMPMMRLVPRGQTTCVDAYLTPLIVEYIKTFEKGFEELKGVDVSFMMSDGGLCPMNDFHGYRSILSGPAGGVVGYALTSYSKENKTPIIGFDMGGTSTDVSRYDGNFHHVYDTETAGITIQAPQLDIHTVAAGGGSKLDFIAGMPYVGPGSVGAHPGPVCYRKGGETLSVTDANLMLGRILPEYFPHIFGPDEKQPLDPTATEDQFNLLTNKINEHNQSWNPEGYKEKTPVEVAMGFIKLANEAMCRAIRNITEAKGYSAKTHVLACFGGAGPQHACAIARTLQMKKVYIHKFSGILSAFGLSLADIVFENQESSGKLFTPEILAEYIPSRFAHLISAVKNQLIQKGFDESNIEIQTFLNLRYTGTDTALMIQSQENKDFDYFEEFRQHYKREFGFTMERNIIIDDIRVRGIGKSKHSKKLHAKSANGNENVAVPEPVTFKNVYFENGYEKTAVYNAITQRFPAGFKISGPAIIVSEISTLIIEPLCSAEITAEGDIWLTVEGNLEKNMSTELDETQLAVFSHRFMSIAEQMGRTLQRTAISTNIKERLDFSCALFCPNGGLVANAPHLPVHLGSMQKAVKWQIDFLGDKWKEGEVIVTNHPAAGGSHLPDITVITPVFNKGKPVFYVASRGHHADIGGITPGSMPPFSHFLYEEGACIQSFKLVENGIFQQEGITNLLLNPPLPPACDKPISGSRAIQDNISDLQAQVAANQKGIYLVNELIEEYGIEIVHAYMLHVQNQAEEAVRQMLCRISLKHNLNEVDKIIAEDYMDDGSLIRLQLTIDRRTRSAVFDFSGTSPETFGNFNTPSSVTYSAIIYSLRCLVSEEIPLNQGCLVPIDVILPEGSILSPSKDAAVVGGNVLTSQRVTDVILQAFGECACSQGCMNNLTFGDSTMGYYETIAGGAGAGPTWKGESGVHSHMTNTRITDPEILELRYPVLLRKFSIRPDSGGIGENNGGNGVIREMEFLKSVEVSILSERRSFTPRGMAGGGDGSRGVNLFLRHELNDGSYYTINLGGKNSVSMKKHDRIRVVTPGGGGYGAAK